MSFPWELSLRFAADLSKYKTLVTALHSGAEFNQLPHQDQAVVLCDCYIELSDGTRLDNDETTPKLGELRQEYESRRRLKILGCDQEDQRDMNRIIQRAAVRFADELVKLTTDKE